MGGEEPLKLLVKTFYDIIENDPDGELVHDLHIKGNGMNHTRLAQFEFLSGFLGGPQLYVDRHQYSNIRYIHEHMEIGEEEIEAWLLCMNKAMNQLNYEESLKEQIITTFTRAASIVKNK